MVIGSYSIELCGGLIVVGGPVFTGIKGYLGTTVIANNHAAGVFGRNPQIVMVAMRGVAAFECLATICAGLVAHIHNIHLVSVFGISINA